MITFTNLGKNDLVTLTSGVPALCKISQKRVNDMPPPPPPPPYEETLPPCNINEGSLNQIPGVTCLEPESGYEYPVPANPIDVPNVDPLPFCSGEIDIRSGISENCIPLPDCPQESEEDVG